MKLRITTVASTLALATTSLTACVDDRLEPAGPMDRSAIGDDGPGDDPDPIYPNRDPGDDDFGGFDDFSDDGFDGAPPVPERLGEVVHAEHTPPPLSGGTLAVSADGAFAIAADPDRDQIYRVRLADDDVKIIALTRGDEPGRIVLDDAGRAHVVLRGAGALARIDLATGELLARAPVCALPRGIVYQPSSGTVTVACAEGDVVSLTADAYEETARKLLDRDLRDVVLDKAGRLLVTRYRSAELLRLTAALELEERASLRTITKPSPFNFTIDGGVPFEDMGVPAAENTLSPTLAWRAVSADDGSVVVVHQRSFDGEVIPAPGGYGGGFGTCDTITNSAISIVDGDTMTTSPTLSDGTLAVDVAVSTKLGLAAVAVPGAYLRAQFGTLQLYSAQTVGSDEPTSCNSPDAQAGFDNQVTSVAFGGEVLVAFSREPAQLVVYSDLRQEADWDGGGWWTSLDDAHVIELDSTSARDTGHDLFHADVGGGLACASCHGEALDDGHVWTFEGFGPRRTQTMRGVLSGTAPFHWEGDMSSFQHLVDEVMTGRMGGFPVETRYTDALAAWIDALPPLTLPVTSEAAVERGRLAFEIASCDDCHAGESLTNNLTMDVGTNGLFQVPSLRGLAMRAPFMHDGCAPTLRDRFSDYCGGTDHGDADKLTPAQLDDLITYLESL